MGVLDGPGEGTWAAFAEKVCAERDTALARVAELERELQRHSFATNNAALDHIEALERGAFPSSILKAARRLLAAGLPSPADGVTLQGEGFSVTVQRVYRCGDCAWDCADALGNPACPGFQLKKGGA